MKKFSILLCSILLFIGCSQDDDDVDSSSNYSISAEIDGQSLIINQNDGGVSGANSGGTTQVTAVTSNDKGFKLFIPEDISTGTQSLDTSSISITYSDDWLSFGNYIMDNGTVTITQFEAWPARVKGSFEGWAFKNTDPTDSIYIDNGLVDLNLQ